MPRAKTSYRKKKSKYFGINRVVRAPEVVENVRIDDEPPMEISANVSDVVSELSDSELMELDISSQDSASKRKLLDSESKYSAFSESCKDFNDIIQLRCIQDALQNTACCKKCHSKLTVTASSRAGLSFNLVIKCTNCENSFCTPNSKKLECKKDEINVRLVYAFRSVGKGEDAAKIFCGVMNMHSPSQFFDYNKILQPAAKAVCQTSMKEAAKKAVEMNDGNLDIISSFDGTWQRRGHSSLNGVLSAISVDVGKVLDINILSKYCRCKENHGPNCEANYAGTSGGMETKGIVQMFERSQELLGVRYKEYLGDGDSSSFSNVVAAKPYGENFQIEKRECVGHVQKRMGTRLRNFKSKMGKTQLADKKQIGGHGRLTGNVILEIQLYYGLAIRRNTGNLEDMRKAVWATFFHLSSSDAKPNHNLCPRGPETWCKYWKAVAQKEKYEHAKHTHLPEIVMNEIKPIFRDLANPELLKKCLHGGTQNPNESLNNTIWSRIPKKTFVMLNTLEIGVYEAAACFNEGNIVKCQILSQLGINPGMECVKAMQRLDRIRIQKAEKAIEEIEKKCRQARSAARAKLEEKFKDQEDPNNPSYSAGGH